MTDKIDTNALPIAGPITDATPTTALALPPAVTPTVAPPVAPHDKHVDVLQFLEECKHLPAPKSAQWLHDKLLSFGGSELPALFWRNKYKSIKKLLEDKVGIGEKFEGNNFTVWGNLLEPVHTHILEMMLSTQIHMTGSVPYRREGFKYTPDGICVVRKDVYERVVGPVPASLQNEQEVVVLMEQKAVAKRQLTAEIPEHYIDQPRSGLCAIPVAEVGLFTESVFKRCALDEWNMESASCSRSFFVAEDWACPLQIGAIMIYTTAVDYHKGMQSVYGRNYTTDMFIDLGACRADTFFAIAADATRYGTTMRIEYVYGDDLESAPHPEGMMLLGVIPWKLYGLSFHTVEKDDTFIERHWPVIAEGRQCLLDCTGATLEEKSARIALAVKRIKELLAAME